MMTLDLLREDAFVEQAQNKGLKKPFDERSVLSTFFSLAVKLAEHVDKYDLVLIDDASGRLPGLVISKWVSLERQAAGQDRPVVKFAQGRYARPENVPDNFIPEKNTAAARTLIVTEGICSGNHVRNLGRLLPANRSAETVDVASLGIFRNQVQPPIDGSNLYTGSNDSYVSNVFYTDLGIDIRGVDSVYQQPFARRIDIANNEMLNQVRVDVRLLASTLFDFTEPSLEAPYLAHTPDIEKVLV
jgi:hypothetical protein